MQYVLEGLLFGLTLSLLVGPILIVLVQSSLERGAKAGMLAASGIWTSDVLIVGFSLYFINQISPFVQSKGFTFWLGIIGGLVLIGTGVLTTQRRVKLDFSLSSLGASKGASYFVKGFLVNTINPFTFIFWLSVISSFVGSRHLSIQETMLFLGSIILVIVFTDSLKVLMAKYIRHKIDDKLLRKINLISGLLLMSFGIALIIRSMS